MPLLPSLLNLDSMTHRYNPSSCVPVPHPSILPSYLSDKAPTLNLCQLHACTWTAECGWRKHIIRWEGSLRFLTTSIKSTFRTAWKSMTLPEIMWRILGDGTRLQARRLGRIWMRDSEKRWLTCGLRKWSQACRSEDALQKHLGGRIGMIWGVKLSLGNWITSFAYIMNRWVEARNNGQMKSF